MRRWKITAIVILAPVVIYVGLIALGNFADARRGHEEVTLLRWADADTPGTAFWISDAPRMHKGHCLLHVRTADQVRSVPLHHDVRFAVVSFVRYAAADADWLLVANGDRIVAGYDYAADRIVGKDDWDRLPFTARREAGVAVASRHVGGEAALPEDLPEVAEPGAASGPASRPDLAPGAPAPSPYRPERAGR
jgi:hypothetical protein